MSTITQPPLQRIRRSPARATALIAGLVLTIAAVALLEPADISDPTSPWRPDLQRMLDGLVTGPNRVAPGATAYVSGPRGTWVGAAGLANAETGEPMRRDAAMHLDSVSKAWTATLILQLIGEGPMRLDDTVERWLPGSLPDGDRITVRQLLNHTSGLIDDNDVTVDPMRFIRRVRDPAIREQALDLLRRQRVDPTVRTPSRFAVRFAAALPLLSEPGARYHYSNVGYDVAGLIASEVTGQSLARLYRERIVEPLGLRRAAFEPDGDVRDYSLRADGELVDATGWYRAGASAGAGIVADAASEARFLMALMRGELLGPAQLQAMKTPTAATGDYGLGIEITDSGCAGDAYEHGGGGYSTRSSVMVSGDGSRVTVLLLNGRVLAGGSTFDVHADAAVTAAASRLFCAG